MSDGTLSARRRDVRNEDFTSQPFPDAPSLFCDVNFESYNARAKNKNRDFGEVRLHMQSSRRLKDYDKFLKNFKYSAALDTVLKKVRISLFLTAFFLIFARVERHSFNSICSDPRISAS